MMFGLMIRQGYFEVAYQNAKEYYFSSPESLSNDGKNMFIFTLERYLWYLVKEGDCKKSAQAFSESKKLTIIPVDVEFNYYSSLIRRLAEYDHKSAEAYETAAGLLLSNKNEEVLFPRLKALYYNTLKKHLKELLESRSTNACALALKEGLTYFPNDKLLIDYQRRIK